MKPFGSRAKGCVAEREVALQLEAWWQPVEPGCKFVRTPSSGGWGTPALRGGFKVAGDIATTAQRWPFTVEVKRREGWKDTPLLAGQKSPVWGWWAQASKAALEEGRVPMLWLRRSREPWRIIIPRQTLRQFGNMVPAIVWTRYPLVERSVLLSQTQPALITWEQLKAEEPGRFARPGLRLVSVG